MATAGEQINRSLRLIGVLAEGETPSADTANDALVALNQMIDSWSTERLAVYSTQTQIFTWPANEVKRTLGPSGDFVGVRPILVDDSTYYVAPNGVSYQINMLNEMQYNSIAVKTVTASYPQQLYVNMTYPDIEMYVYPVPSQPLEWHIVSVRELSQPATLTTELHFPPGYMRAFAYNLACELAPEFGVEPSPQVQRIAMTSKRNLKRINNPGDVMALPLALTYGRMGYNIYIGSY
jgi:hypothetical protein